MRRFYLAPLHAYQYISRLLPASCRYYPSCSEYAKWQFTFNRPDKAFVQTTLRILRCNQLFEGGIDYPIIPYHPPRLICPQPDFLNIHYWFYPKEAGYFYVIKNYESNSLSLRGLKP